MSVRDHITSIMDILALHKADIKAIAEQMRSIASEPDAANCAGYLRRTAQELLKTLEKL